MTPHIRLFYVNTRRLLTIAENALALFKFGREEEDPCCIKVHLGSTNGENIDVQSEGRQYKRGAASVDDYCIEFHDLFSAGEGMIVYNLLEFGRGATIYDLLYQAMTKEIRLSP